MAYIGKLQTWERFISYDDSRLCVIPDNMETLKKIELSEEVIDLIKKATFDEVQLILSNYI